LIIKHSSAAVLKIIKPPQEGGFVLSLLVPLELPRAYAVFKINFLIYLPSMKVYYT
jgi:hypothetical protein